MTLVNHVSQIQAECTKCDKSLVALNGDMIIIYPMKLMHEWQLIILCKKCFDELEEEE